MPNAERALYLQAFLHGLAGRHEEPNEVYTFLFEPVPEDYARDHRVPCMTWLSAIRGRLDAFLIGPEEADALMRLLIDVADGMRVTVWEIAGGTADEILRAEWLFDLGDAVYRLYLGMREDRN